MGPRAGDMMGEAPPTPCMLYTREWTGTLRDMLALLLAQRTLAPADCPFNSASSAPYFADALLKLAEHFECVVVIVTLARALAIA